MRTDIHSLEIIQLAQVVLLELLLCEDPILLGVVDAEFAGCLIIIGNRDAICVGFRIIGQRDLHAGEHDTVLPDVFGGDVGGDRCFRNVEICFLAFEGVSKGEDRFFLRVRFDVAKSRQLLALFVCFAFGIPDPTEIGHAISRDVIDDHEVHGTVEIEVDQLKTVIAASGSDVTVDLDLFVKENGVSFLDDDLTRTRSGAADREGDTFIFDRIEQVIFFLTLCSN